MTQPETVNITPDPRLREWMLGVWRDPKQEAFRQAVRAHEATLLWLCPVCFEPVEPHDPNDEPELVCHRELGHAGDHADWAPGECLVDGCACRDPQDPNCTCSHPVCTC